MTCIFCCKSLTLKEDVRFNYYICNRCYSTAETKYVQSYNKDGQLLGEKIKIDEFYIIINYRELVTNIFKNINWGLLPTANYKHAFTYKGILNLPYSDLDRCKQKLIVYTIFS